MIFIEDIYLFFSLLIASINRAFFCSVSHRIFQILMRRRQKAKILFSLFTRLRRAFIFSYRSCILLFCFSLSFSNFDETSTKTKNHLSYLFIYRSSMLLMFRLSSSYSSSSLNVVIDAAIKLISIRKWFRVYKSFSNLFFFFSFSSSFSWRLSIASRMLLNESYWRMTILNSKWLSIHERQTCRFHEISISLKENNVMMQIRIEKTTCNDSNQKRINDYQILILTLMNRFRYMRRMM